MIETRLILFSGQRATVTRIIGLWSDGTNEGPIVNAWIGDRLVRHIHAQRIRGEWWQVTPGEKAKIEVA